MIHQPAPRWRKSSYSGGEGGQCVELADSLAAIRDSKNADGPALLGDVRLLVAAVKTDRLGR